MKIGKKEIGPGNPVYIVAEAGINHNGDMSIAKKMIEKAAQCGVDAIKFQTIISDDLFSPLLSPDWFDLCKKWAFTKKQHLELMRHAKKIGIDFFSTPVGKKSAELLHDVDIKMIKISSGDITNHELIQNISKWKLPLVISTGMTMISEISQVVEILREQKSSFMLLHCNSSYPTSIEEANLLTIGFLRDTFGVPIGYSDHVMGEEACLAAVALGACMIEKHFTLDKNMEGPDQKLSADPKEFASLVSKIRMVEKSLGSVRTGPTTSELKFKKLMRKSIGTSMDIRSGTKIKKSMLTTFRPGTGISPPFIDKFVGMTIKKDVKKGTLINWDMF